MRAHWHDLWGSGLGPVARIVPRNRILAGTLLFAACLAAPSGTVMGAAFIAAVTAGWTAACGLPRRALASFALLGLAMFLPYVLLVPLIAPIVPAGPGPARLAAALAVPWDVVLHGLAGLFVAAATVSALSVSDLRRGLLALPLPRMLTAVLIQIVHQTAALAAETGRIAAATAVRGGTQGVSTAWRLAAGLPRIWLPRVVGRAERVAAAMELRGYAETDLRVFGRDRLRPADAAVVALALGLLGLAAALRWGWLR
ncbi:MAG TPA: energy-coupling factor transporter transmembrane component T [Candidatus Aminicenantes bacterium]|nr:energy-coupling factor transporter transmembrane component T [Candidatus Aminicenantes bacterium]HRY65171.1 energy-coupling factor transporter transmembrane component T [Candidatus Aminicenantes bacterium]HRZ72361.1 energy-coupling factor transporter transmembrane component T [Candidatus Aminicenantes bacterium]